MVQVEFRSWRMFREVNSVSCQQSLSAASGFSMVMRTPATYRVTVYMLNHIGGGVVGGGGTGVSGNTPSVSPPQGNTGGTA